ncbi:MAG: hypothetical protein VYA34_00995 [Myxococcota bacterium]|nr:hypothetical protein [Myxococcota bacterium]
MFRYLTFITMVSLVSLVSVGPALAENQEETTFSEYSLSASLSPFGGSLNFGYNASEKTTWQVSVGGFKGGAPFKPKIGGTEYSVSGYTQWVGCFINHRPISGHEWFRVVAGMGLGTIQNRVKDDAGNEYRVDYKENPVGYVGIGFGAEAKQGFIWGFDIGLLHTGGPQYPMKVASADGDTSNASEEIADYWFFGSVLPNLQLTLGYGF